MDDRIIGWRMTATSDDWWYTSAPRIGEGAEVSVYPGVTVGNEAVEAELRYRISILEALWEQERQSNTILLARIAGLEDDCNEQMETLFGEFDSTGKAFVPPYPDNPLTKERKARGK